MAEIKCHFPSCHDNVMHSVLCFSLPSWGAWSCNRLAFILWGSPNSLWRDACGVALSSWAGSLSWAPTQAPSWQLTLIQPREWAILKARFPSPKRSIKLMVCRTESDCPVERWSNCKFTSKINYCCLGHYIWFIMWQQITDTGILWLP